MNWDVSVQEVAKLVESKESYQKKLGQIASEITVENGSEALKTFAIEVKEISGLSISPTTLRNYAWVWNKTKDLDLPDDIPYRVYQALSGTSNPKEWADKIVNEGLSGPEIIRLIRESKGLSKREKLVVCPACGNKFDINAQS